ncbi:tetratricopeptide repeat protein [Micromonospora zingiberis]|uniref:Tetratricopeptide repeat protein n=1 Tax=Micromonospora zingiberis TaxID=2053011 RepID=A0A4R0GFN0_9ACTN|nr:BTAD domain-containing putative transcriptional regulator [Micromonospora zingiberis]TCB95417.1 tetratricopeptide repeat protein [Micromonospora zingiberis]
MTAGGGNGDLWLEVMGPLRIRRSGVELDLGPRQQRLVLALLLAHVDRVVPVGEIVDALWEQPPSSAVNVVQRHIGGLRRLLEPDFASRSASRWIVSDPVGYRLLADAEQLDLLRFRALRERGIAAEHAGRTDEALSHYVTALPLWRGPCGSIPELQSQQPPVFGLVDRECVDLVRRTADLAQRGCAVRSVLPALRRAAELFPLDEALHAQLLATLSADGKQAEAIAVYQDICRRLADDLEVGPGEQLRQAYTSVLRANGTRAVAGTSPQATMPHRHDGVPAGARTDRSPLPAQLPHDLPQFIGRGTALRRAASAIEGNASARATMPILAIDGLPGIGKTTFAVHLAHQLAAGYPDGQLYVDMRGFDPNGALDPSDALQGFLNAFGLPDSEIPTEMQARSGLYRSALAGRRVLVVVDNVRDAEQVRPLLPGAPGCVVLVTSRRRLTALATGFGADLITLDMLSIEQSRELVTARMGAAEALAERDAMDQIAQRCGGLPLALAVVAARAMTYPGNPLPDIARELRHAGNNLDVFTSDDLENQVRAVFSWSYRLLSPRAMHLFRLLPLHRGPDIAMPAVASLLGASTQETRGLLGELVRTRLLVEHVAGRYRTHDLIRAYAHELSLESEPEAVRQQALGRLADHYRQSAHRASFGRLAPALSVPPPKPMSGVTIVELSGFAEATAWFTAERHVLKSLIQGAIDDGESEIAWQLALNMQVFFQHEGWWHDWVTITRSCLQATVKAGDTLGEAHIRRSLAGAVHTLGDREEAIGLLTDALRLFTERGAGREQALVHRNLGQVYLVLQERSAAIGHFEQAVRIFESVADVSQHATALYCLAGAHARSGSHELATVLAHEALAMCDRIGDALGRGECYLTLADVSQAQGNYDESVRHYRLAIDSFGNAGSRTSMAECYLHFGATAQRFGDRVTARDAWEEVLTILAEAALPLADDARRRLAALDRAA